MSAPPADPAEYITLREFARRDGCSEKEVRRAIEKGNLVKTLEGRLPATAVGTAWRKRYRKTAARRAVERADTRCGHCPCLHKCPHLVSAPQVSALNGPDAITHTSATRICDSARTFAAMLDGSGFEGFLSELLAGRFASLAEALWIKENALALKHLLAARVEALKLIEATGQAAHALEPNGQNQVASSIGG